jgi:hypothetical protein
MKIAIVGSRDFPNLALVRRFVSELPKDTIIVSGGARGVDREGELAAYDAGLATHIIFADWKTYGKEAGPIRNAAIVKTADKIVVFWDGRSPGTANVLGLARMSGKPVELYICRRAPKGISDNPGVLQPLRWPFVKAAPAPATAAQAVARRQRGRG